MSARRTPRGAPTEAVDVVVVGAGPAGLAAAATLGRYGIPTLLVERRTGQPTLPKATGLSTRTMEILRSWGLEDRVQAGGVDAEMWLWECTTLADAAAGTARSVGIPSRAQAGVVSPTTPAVVPQDWLETVLRDHVRTLSSVRFELGAEVVGFAELDDAVCVTVRDRTDDLRRIHARHLVAADGAHSPTRRCLGIAMDEREGAFGGVQVVFRAPLWDLVGDVRYGLYSVTTPVAPGLFLPAGRPDRWVYGAATEPEDRHGPGIDPTRLAEWIRLGAGLPIDPVIERVGAFHSPGQIATRFRLGRTFLVGDAAHRVTPVAAPGSTPPSTMGTTSGGSWRGRCSAGPGRRCSTPTRPSGAPSPSTT